MIGKILVGFDGSECSQRALDFSLDLAEKFNAAITVLNVMEIPVHGNPEDPLAGSAGMAGLLRDVRKTHQSMLDKALAQAKNQKPGVNVSVQMQEGSPPDQIVTTAIEGGFNVVVVGHGSEGRIKELFLGGTSERVAHLSRCTVVIVK